MSAVGKFVHFPSRSHEKLLVPCIAAAIIGFTWCAMQSLSVSQHEKGLLKECQQLQKLLVKRISVFLLWPS